MEPALLCDLGLMAYADCHALQLELAAWRHQGRLAHDCVLCVEHPPVYTLGRRGNRSHLGVSETFLEARGIEVVPVERGGEITYHGPGQLVVYPIVDLRQRRLSVGDYVWLLEELMLRLALNCGVTAGRDPRNHGVWVGNSKLGSVGIAIRHGVSFHGLALNVDLDLEPFSWINPCGLQDVDITSLARQGAADCSLAQMKSRLPHHLGDLFAEPPQVIDYPGLRNTCPAPPVCHAH